MKLLNRDPDDPEFRKLAMLDPGIHKLATELRALAQVIAADPKELLNLAHLLAAAWRSDREAQDKLERDVEACERLAALATLLEEARHGKPSRATLAEEDCE